MNVFLDWLLIIFSTLIVISSFNAIIENKYSSTAHFIIVVEYIICCFPILLNYVAGYPQYKTIYWYRVFKVGMQNATVSYIYDIYILCCIVLLRLYSYYYDNYKAPYIHREYQPFNSILKSRLILVLSILSPFIYVILTGNFSFFLTYGVRTSRYSTENGAVRVVSMLILLSIYAYSYYLFTSERKKRKIILTIVYIIAITWLQGKRFILVIIGLVSLFFFTRKGLTLKEQRKLKVAIPILAIAIIGFSGWYLIYIRPLSNTSFDSVYDMLRVDLGRDDVIKYVIEKVIIEKQSFIPYPGSTFLSTFLFFIPRSIWPTKPYPHYVYLTSSILNVPIMEIPAGTTPSWLEMSIANFDVFGFIFGIISIPILCMLVDKINVTTYQLIAVVLVAALLTQNIDAYLMFVLIFVIQFLIRHSLGNREIVFTWKGKEL